MPISETQWNPVTYICALHCHYFCWSYFAFTLIVTSQHVATYHMVQPFGIDTASIWCFNFWFVYLSVPPCEVWKEYWIFNTGVTAALRISRAMMKGDKSQGSVVQKQSEVNLGVKWSQQFLQIFKWLIFSIKIPLQDQFEESNQCSPVLPTFCT